MTGLDWSGWPALTNVGLEKILNSNLVSLRQAALALHICACQGQPLLASLS